MSRTTLLSAALTLGCFAGLAPQHAGAQNITTERIATGFSLPLYVTAPTGDTDRLFVVQQRGLIRIIDLNTNATLVTPFLNLAGTVSGSGNERGLLGMAFHPNYMSNGRFFVSYTANSNGASHVVEYQATPPGSNTASATPVQTIFTISQPFSNHNGGCIQFGPDGKLYVGMGDGGSANDPGNRAQNLNNSLGKMLRFDVDIPSPFIPSDNPFVGVTGNDEIWAYGLRNPWRFSFDRATGDMYIADVGQNQWEEVDFQPAASTGGENYGWRCREGAHPFNTAGCPPVATMVDPIQEYSHSLGCSISGGYVYRGSNPGLAGLSGTYFYADYCSNRIWSLRYDGTTVTEFMLRSPMNPPGSTVNSITSFGEDAAGELYIVDQGGEIFRIIEDVPPCVGSALSYCVTSPNASGAGAVLFAGGSTNISDNDFTISVGGGNPNNFGIFFYGTAPGQSPGGNGMLCVDTTTGLYRVYPVVPLDFIGLGFRTFDFNAPPMDSGPGQIFPGTTYYFQFWYRDPGGPGPTDYNFSDGIMATFCP